MATRSLGYFGGGGSGGGGYLPGSQGSQMSPGGGKVSTSCPSIQWNIDEYGSILQPKISASLRPVMIRQILDATQEHGDAEFMIDGSDPTQVCSLPLAHLLLGGPESPSINVSYS